MALSELEREMVLAERQKRLDALEERTYLKQRISVTKQGLDGDRRK